MKKIKLNSAALHLSKEKIVSLSSQEINYVNGGDVGSLVSCTTCPAPKITEMSKCIQCTDNTCNGGSKGLCFQEG